eukprot:6487575-Amphidinium_carterae.1
MPQSFNQSYSFSADRFHYLCVLGRQFCPSISSSPSHKLFKKLVEKKHNNDILSVFERSAWRARTTATAATTTSSTSSTSSTTSTTSRTSTTSTTTSQ